MTATKEELCKENRIRIMNHGAKSDYIIYELRGKLSPCYGCESYFYQEDFGHYCHRKKELR